MLGFPAANLGEVTEILPPHGVYAVRIGTDGEKALAGYERVGGTLEALPATTTTTTAFSPCAPFVALSALVSWRLV